MNTRRRVLLAILIIVTLVIGGRNLNKQESNQENQVENFSDAELERFVEEMTRINKELERLIVNADMTIKDYQNLPQPTNGTKKSYHDGGHENAWVQDVDEKEGLVLVTTVDSKMSIIFKPAPEDLKKFHVGWIAPVTFQCTKKNKGKCDFDSPYKLFVSNGLVKVELLKFPDK